MPGRRELVGRIREVVDDKLVLDEHLDDVDEIGTADAFLEPRMEILERLLGTPESRVRASGAEIGFGD